MEASRKAKVVLSVFVVLIIGTVGIILMEGIPQIMDAIKEKIPLIVFSVTNKTIVIERNTMNVKNIILHFVFIFLVIRLKYEILSL